MPALNSKIASPLAHIDDLIQATGFESIEDIENSVKKHFEDIWEPENLCKVPIISNFSRWQCRRCTLVRFRGMIQDMLYPECFVWKYKANQTTMAPGPEYRTFMYRDFEMHEENGKIVAECVRFPSSQSQLQHRELFHCIALPGESPWVLDYFRNQQNLEKGLVHEKQSDAANSSDGNDPERMKPEPCNVVFIKLYDPDMDVVINEMLDIIGVYCDQPQLYANLPERLGPTEKLSRPMAAHRVKLPRLHVVAYRKVTNSNPVLVYNFPTTVTKSNTEIGDFLANVNEYRHKIINILSEMMLGDQLAAEYLLGLLVSSRSRRRKCGENSLHFSMNLFNLPKNYAYWREVVKLLKALLPKVVEFEFTAENIKDKQLFPYQDPDTYHLETAPLQLSNQTMLVIKEAQRVMEPLDVDTKGRFNLDNVKSMLTRQSVLYDLGNQCLEVDTLYMMLWMSHSASTVKCNVEMPLTRQIPVEDYPTANGLIATLSADELKTIRQYLGVVPNLAYEEPKETMEIFSKDHAESHLGETITQQDFHIMLAVARAMSFSYAKEVLDVETWARVLDMEQLRRNRFKK